MGRVLINKPYPFYDWVPTARAEIEARGAAPVPLGVEPGGAEFAEPAETFVTGDETVPEPDLGNRIYQDPAELILVEALTVPTSIMAGSSTRAHLTFRPNLQRKAHWNNEAEDMVFWVNPPDGWGGRCPPRDGGATPASRQPGTAPGGIRDPQP